MKTHLLKTFAFLMLTAAYGLSAYAQKHQGFVLNGTITGAANGDVVKLIALDEQKILDSATVLNGRFTLKGRVENPVGCWLTCKNEYAVLRVENTRISFQSPLKDMDIEHRCTGGHEQQLQTQLHALRYRYLKPAKLVLDSINNKLYTNKADHNRMALVFNTLQRNAQAVYVNFGKQHPNSYLGQDIIYMNRQDINRDSLKNLYAQMSPVFKKSQPGIGLYYFLNSTLAEKGKPFIDFTAKTIDGADFKLSSLKGKYIYLSFGSIGCGPCRMENKELAANYASLSPKLEIVSFSLDRHKKDWQRMVKEDSMVWHNVSDLQGNGKIKNIYNVQGIPTAFLINPEGIIIERYYGYWPGITNDVKEKTKL